MRKYRRHLIRMGDVYHELVIRTDKTLSGDYGFRLCAKCSFFYGGGGGGDWCKIPANNWSIDRRCSRVHKGEESYYREVDPVYGALLEADITSGSKTTRGRFVSLTPKEAG
jgi:hypothetical protein